MVREGQKHSESVRRGSAIGHECWNMRPEPGVAHHLLPTEIMTVPSHLNEMHPKPKIKKFRKAAGAKGNVCKVNRPAYNLKVNNVGCLKVKG